MFKTRLRLAGEDAAYPLKTLVFVQTKRTADFLAASLSQATEVGNLPATSIHGSVLCFLLMIDNRSGFDFDIIKILSKR